MSFTCTFWCCSKNSVVPALTTNTVAGVYVAKPPVTKLSAINLAQANAAHPLQNCRLYYSRVQMDPQKAITYNNANTDNITK